MSTYLKTRERIAKESKALESFSEVIEYRYENLGNTLEYIKHIWAMTKNYVNYSFELFKTLDEKATKSSIQSLTIVTSMGVGATLIGLFTESEPSFTTFGIRSFASALIGYLTSKGFKWYNQEHKFKIKDISFDKNIT